jgi:Notch-like protein
MAGYQCELSQTPDLCRFSPCLNGGFCYPVGRDNTACACPPHTTGRYCEQDLNESNACYSSPCLNNGTCLKNGSSYMCICPNNVSGQNCENTNQPQSK